MFLKFRLLSLAFILFYTDLSSQDYIVTLSQDTLRGNIISQEPGKISFKPLDRRNAKEIPAKDLIGYGTPSNNRFYLTRKLNEDYVFLKVLILGKILLLKTHENQPSYKEAIFLEKEGLGLIKALSKKPGFLESPENKKRIFEWMKKALADNKKLSEIYDTQASFNDHSEMFLHAIIGEYNIQHKRSSR